MTLRELKEKIDQLHLEKKPMQEEITRLNVELDSIARDFKRKRSENQYVDRDIYVRRKRLGGRKHYLQNKITEINIKLKPLKLLWSEKTDYNRLRLLIEEMKGMLSKEQYLEVWERVEERILNGDEATTGVGYYIPNRKSKSE